MDELTPTPERIRKSDAEIERALEIMVQSVQGNTRTGGDARPPALAAMALGWVLGWEKVGGEFQSIIDDCNRIDEGREKRHTHGKRKR